MDTDYRFFVDCSKIMEHYQNKPNLHGDLVIRVSVKQGKPVRVIRAFEESNLVPDMRDENGVILIDS